MFEELWKFLNSHIAVSALDFEVLMKKMELREYKKKTCLTEIGETEDYLYFILKGLTRKFFYRGTDEIITHIVKEGGIIASAASFFSGMPSKYRVEALEPTTVLRLSRTNLEELFSMGNKWEKIGRVITSHFFIQQEVQILDSIRLTVRERFVKFMNENPDLIQRVPQKYLASFLNIKQETFSRLKHLMLDKK